MDDNLKVVGTLTVKHYNEDNVLLNKQEIPNLVVTAGKSHIAGRITANAASAGTSLDIMSHMGLGGDSTTPVAGDTVLGSEMGRVALASTTVAANTITYNATFPGGTATGTVNEAGIFNNPSANSGTILCRTVFADVNKGASDAVVITWNVSVA